jgi:hypothetical protein
MPNEWDRVFEIAGGQREKQNPLTVPDVTEHTLRAYDLESNRPVRIAPIRVPPGEKAPVRLKYGGRTAAQYLQDCITGEVEWYAEHDRNQTKGEVIVYHGIWGNTGNHAGYFWPEHLRFPDPGDE